MKLCGGRESVINSPHEKNEEHSLGEQFKIMEELTETWKDF